MMTQAFYSGISGVRTNSTGIDVVTDNIANISTTGYRGYNLEFTSLFEEKIASIGKNALDSSVGVGSRVQAISMTQKTGSLLLTDRSTDLAISGEGWFAIQGVNEPIYTRDGTFSFDANDDLVSLEGYHVLGTMGKNISTDNILTAKIDEVKLANVTAQEKLRFPRTLTYPAEATTEAKFFANVGVNPEVQIVGASVIDPLGNRNNLRLEFTKDPIQTLPGSQWNVTATTQTLDGATIYDTQTGRVVFDEAGALVSQTLSTIDNNGAPISINLGSGYDGIVSIDVPLLSGSSSADGIIRGDLMGYSINKNAEVIATFSNGQQSSVGKVALFHFQNDQGLERLNGTHFQESSNSGRPIFYTDTDGNNINGTQVINFKLESSNYEMSQGLTELILLQRAFDANSKSITTADQMIKKALEMHR
ncbi:MAG TPA: flagellar basal body rod protein [Sulfurimonas sp. UBA12504]|nr:MAG: flagellar basal body rod protein [Sulfurimonas sp. GWF2_37_8]DAB30235.1 MAG TPA: flagellar basal body rod protein [Sulfurimonas sp. UBA12504]